MHDYNEVEISGPQKFEPSDVVKDFELFSLGRIMNLTDIANYQVELDANCREAMWMLRGILLFIDDASLRGPDESFLGLLEMAHETVQNHLEITGRIQDTERVMEQNDLKMSEYKENIKGIGDNNEDYCS